MMKGYTILLALILLSTSGCSDDPTPAQTPVVPNTVYSYLALGDSYTIGQSVCNTCSFPAQLANRLEQTDNQTIAFEIIAQTGWTTTNLKDAIAAEQPGNQFDLVTLLIGVNNQYQNKPFSLYETEFPQLVSTAIAAANGDKNNVIVVSIPDYAYTPAGQSLNPEAISQQIDQYNSFAESYCAQQDIGFVNITDITRNGLSNQELVANDGLHPSEDAYALFVERLLPIATSILNN